MIDVLEVLGFKFKALCCKYPTRIDIISIIIIILIIYRLTDTAHIILVDDNMFYHSMRYEYVQLARKCKSIFVSIFFTISFL